jgi:Ca2+-dependent lipid-binding protein
MQTLAPSWDEAQEVPLSRRRALMHVVLFDWDKVGTDDFLGEALLALDEYLDGARH